jgi:hypothetical protein
MTSMNKFITGLMGLALALVGYAALMSFVATHIRSIVLTFGGC